MKTKILVMICAGVIFGFVVGRYLLKKYYNTVSHFDPKDLEYAHQVLEDIYKNKIEEVSNEKLEEHFVGGNVLLSKHPESDDKKEDMAFFNGPANTRYWPYYHYTFPYQHTEGGAWPPNMFSRMYNWQPGYATSGWSYWMRPGMSYSRWPRNRWIRNNGSFYFINQGKDRSKDFL